MDQEQEMRQEQVQLNQEQEMRQEQVQLNQEQDLTWEFRSVLVQD